MYAKEKIPVTAWLSTVFIGVYTLFLVIGMARIALLLFYTKHITTAGTHMVSEARMMSDYISGYMVLPGAFTTLLGSFTGVMALLLAVGIFIPVLVCLVTLVISCILLKKKKLQTDAWMKLIVFLILSVISFIIFQSIWICIIMVIPVILSIRTLSTISNTE